MARMMAIDLDELTKSLHYYKGKVEVSKARQFNIRDKEDFKAYETATSDIAILTTISKVITMLKPIERGHDTF